MRALRPDEIPAASALFRSTLHVKPVSDEDLPYARRWHQPGRTLGVFDSELIGTARSFDAELTVPGGKRRPLAGVTGVGVRPDRTRRGVLSELMRTQLSDFTDRGVVFAALYASEASIYGRFGYGVSTVFQSSKIDRRRARLRPGVSAGGRIDLLPLDPGLDRLAGLYEELPHRAGMMTRPPYWWAAFEWHLRRAEAPVHAIVHTGPEGPDGFAVYKVERPSWDQPSTLDVLELQYANSDAFAGLWRYLLTVDLVDEIAVGGRAPDEPTPLLFADSRACTITGGGDDLWLRLVDVEQALAAREYEGEPVVVEVSDRMLERNSGRYRISAEGAERTEEPAELSLDAGTLAMLYFGTWRPSALAGVGRISAAGPEVPRRADRLFATPVSGWCGTHF